MHLRCFHYCITSIYSLSGRDVELLTGNLAELIKWQQAFFTSLENSSRSGLHLYTYNVHMWGTWMSTVCICVHCTFVTEILSIFLVDLVVERQMFNKNMYVQEL